MVTETRGRHTLISSPPITVRLVDGCGNSRLLSLPEDVYQLAWYDPMTGRTVTFLPAGRLTDGRGRPLWSALIPEAATEAPVRAIRPHTAGALVADDRESADWWDELYAAVPPMPPDILAALLAPPDAGGVS